ncbi:hypothetical protein PENSPDRAFT_299890 [Peniophora sp. CONT]|nr:hypothetical protein PENSPDRAFT_299890 [Peniophora sp. CONT]
MVALMLSDTMPTREEAQQECEPAASLPQTRPPTLEELSLDAQPLRVNVAYSSLVAHAVRRGDSIGYGVPATRSAAPLGRMPRGEDCCRPGALVKAVANTARPKRQLRVTLAKRTNLARIGVHKAALERARRSARRKRKPC